jgi:vacuolar-type H+-ATPase subunit C/Vma6
MSRTSRYAFITAKVYGVMARSFIGAGYRDLLRLKSLAELSDRLFPGERAQAADEPVPIELEARIVRASIEAMTGVLDYLGDAPPILVHTARKLEYQNVKSVVRGMVHGTADEPRIWDLGRYAAIRLQGATDPRKAIKASPYSWILPLIGTVPLAELENRLDRDYYEKFLQLTRALPARDRTGVLRLITAEIALANVVWALRLRFYFKLDAQSARVLLIPGTSSSVRAALAEVFEIPADSAEGWRKWRYGWLLEDQLGDAFAAPDPVRAEQKASQALYARAHQSFHQNPFTLGPLVAYFKLKEYEASLLGIAVEALHLSVPEQDILNIVGAR